MSFLATVDDAEASGATAELYARERHRVGHVPGYARVFGARTGVYDAWRLMVGELTKTMPPRRFELVTLVAARELRSTYCSVAHGTILTKFLSDDDVARLARGDVPDALDEQERAVVAFAGKAARAAADITADDVEGLRRHGLDDEEILDVILATAARCFFSTVLDATGTLADAGFAERMTPDLREALTVGRPLATP
ncbi:MAG TPA: hypothetical protein VI357_27900 [Mycobacteriales bacterium]